MLLETVVPVFIVVIASFDQFINQSSVLSGCFPTLRFYHYKLCVSFSVCAQLFITGYLFNF